ncbi:MAG: peroxide stress protein YaaA [Magnetococcales bacterium]|nr:peroxide stress protein YaaA [Magnetococcales bacterium]
MLAVISPAKKQDFSADLSQTAHTQPQLLAETRLLAEIMRRHDQESLMKLMKISAQLGALNVERFQRFSPIHTLKNAKSALFAFQGDTYVGLESRSFDEEDLAFAQAHLGILSGFYGYLRPLDLIQPHRLEMGTRLETERGGNLYAFWDHRVTEVINGMLVASSGSWLINLASTEYFKVVRGAHLQGRVLTPEFKEEKNGQLKVIGIHAKRARGAMARFMIQNRLTDPEGLQAFSEGGYRYQPELSDEARWVFAR